MRHTDVRQSVTKTVQKVFWIYLTENFTIARSDELVMFEPATPCHFVPITVANAERVAEFRHRSRIADYRNKIAHGEIGFFAESKGKTAGSIWATVNRTTAPKVARMYMKLLPGEVLIHDIVTSDGSRGQGIGPYMVGQISSVLLRDPGVTRIIIDVNVKNRPSLRMMEKAGIRAAQKVMYVSAFGRLIFQTVREQYA